MTGKIPTVPAPMALVTVEAQHAADRYTAAVKRMMRGGGVARADLEEARSYAAEFTVAMLLANRRTFGYGDEVEAMARAMRGGAT